MDLFKELQKKSGTKQKTIILPESYDERVISAVKEILKNKLAKVILIQTNKNIEQFIKPHKSLTIIDINFAKDFLEEHLSLKKMSKPATPDPAVV